MRTNTSQPKGAGKIFRKTARLDLVRPSRPRKHLCTCNVTTPRRDGKTAKMEVNELLGRFEKVKNSTACYYGLGLPILNETLGKAHKKSLAPKKRGIISMVMLLPENWLYYPAMNFPVAISYLPNFPSEFSKWTYSRPTTDRLSFGWLKM